MIDNISRHREKGMTVKNRLIPITAVLMAMVVGTMTIVGQLPIPVPGQQGPAGTRWPGGGGGGGAGAQGGRADARSSSGAGGACQTGSRSHSNGLEVMGPGRFYETFMDNHDDDKNARFPRRTLTPNSITKRANTLTGNFERHALQDTHCYSQSPKTIRSSTE